MPYRQSIQLVTNLPPLRHEPVHQRLKPRVVSRLDQMQQLMHENVFQAVWRLASQVRIQADVAGYRVEASPIRLHALHENVLGSNLSVFDHA